KFALLLLIIILPFKFLDFYKTINLSDLKNKVVLASEAGFSSFINGSKDVMNLDFNKASNNFSEASEKFFSAEKELGEINSLLFRLAAYAPSDEARLAAYSREMLAAGENAAILGENMSLALQSLFSGGEKDMAKILDNFVLYGEKSREAAASLNSHLSQIDIDVLPIEYREQFIFLRNKSADLEAGLGDFILISEKLKEFLGVAGNKRYLLVFQNNSEMRGSGGFVGSYALVDFQNGKIKNIEAPAGGSYDTTAGLRESVLAPEPFWLIGTRWFFWNANWWPDWPTSAEKLKWFYEKSDGPTVDGVISFTPTVLERILRVLGPIDMTAKYGVVIDADNFWDTTQKIVEAGNLSEEELDKLKDSTSGKVEVDKAKPKEIIRDLMDAILVELPKRINNKDKFVEILKAIEGNLNEKHILFYFTDEKLEKEIAQRGWDGKMEENKWDYLSVVNTNIYGQKSDKVIDETINHQAEIADDGSIIDTVVITRKHNASRGDLFTGVRNLDWMRVYVPAGSELLSAEGFSELDEKEYIAKQPEESLSVDPFIAQTENLARIDEENKTKIYNENGKTVFANWFMLEPGEIKTVVLKYKLPFTIKEAPRDDAGWFGKIENLLNPDQKSLLPYSLFVQKQPGSIGDKIISNLFLPANLRAVWKYPVSSKVSENGWHIEDVLNVDKYYAMVIEK
ncbi:MAG: DUF4012 domain-containing protein, partial [Patescibacteria group bacterium]|nr:DUF4012 domain-containing protein [Patescibacteria group bacterium]